MNVIIHPDTIQVKQFINLFPEFRSWLSTNVSTETISLHQWSLSRDSSLSRDKRRGTEERARSQVWDRENRSPPFLFRVGSSTLSHNASFIPLLDILDNERDWRRRGIKEALWERVEDPTLNRKGGLRFSLSHNWDRALSSVPRRLSRDSELSRDKLHWWRLMVSVETFVDNQDLNPGKRFINCFTLLYFSECNQRIVMNRKTTIF